MDLLALLSPCHLYWRWKRTSLHVLRKLAEFWLKRVGVLLCAETRGHLARLCTNVHDLWKKQNRDVRLWRGKDIGPVIPGTGKAHGAEGLEEELKHLKEGAWDRVTCTAFGINGNVWLVISLFLSWVSPWYYNCVLVSSTLKHRFPQLTISSSLLCWYSSCWNQNLGLGHSQRQSSANHLCLTDQLNRQVAMRHMHTHAHKGDSFNVATLGRGTNKEAPMTKIG